MQVYGPLDAATFENVGADPAAVATSVGRVVFRTDLNSARIQINATTWAGLGSGGGGGGGLRWNGADGTGPSEGEENGELVYFFEASLANKLTVWLKIPQSYPGGQPIQMYHSLYSTSTANNFKMQTASYLVRKNQDAVTSTVNAHTTNTGDLLNTVASQYREITTDITDSSGLINGVAVSAGDLVRIDLSRIGATGTEDSAEVRFVPSSTEVTFS